MTVTGLADCVALVASIGVSRPRTGERSLLKFGGTSKVSADYYCPVLLGWEWESDYETCCGADCEYEYERWKASAARIAHGERN